MSSVSGRSFLRRHFAGYKPLEVLQKKKKLSDRLNHLKIADYIKLYRDSRSFKREVIGVTFCEFHSKLMKFHRDKKRTIRSLLYLW